MSHPDLNENTINPVAFLHFASAVGAIFPFGPILGPYIVHYFAKDQWRDSYQQLKKTKHDILFFQLPLSIISILFIFFLPTYLTQLPLEAMSNSLTFVIIPMLASLLGFIQFVVPLYAGIRILSGHSYKYPTLINLKNK